MKNIVRRLVTTLLVFAAISTAAARLLAHAVVYPASAKTGAYERYVLRVPNEREVPTTRVEMRFPSSITVVSFGEVPGWTIEMQTDSAQRIIGAVWTGTLPPKRFVELPFIAVNPREPATLSWPAFQTYADGERVAWTGAPGSERPASVTEVGAASVAEGAAPASGAAASASGSGSRAILPLMAAMIALGIAILAVGLAIGAQRRTR